MKAETIPLLRSPISHSPLKQVTEVRNGVVQESLVAFDTQESFLIEDGIPVLLDQSRVVGYNKKYQGFYNRVAPLYDATLALGAKLLRGNVDRFRTEYLRELELKPGDRFLEVSVGTGANLKLLPQDIACYGLDISHGMLKRCRRKLASWGRDCELILGDAEELPFVDTTFDSVLHVGGINAFNNRQKALAEMVRVAKPGSRIVVVDENARLVGKLRWIPGTRRVMKEYAERLEAPVHLLPAGMEEVEAHDVVHGGLYCLSFRKPK